MKRMKDPGWEKPTIFKTIENGHFKTIIVSPSTNSQEEDNNPQSGYIFEISNTLVSVGEAKRELRKFVEEEEEPPQETASGEEANDCSVSYDTTR
jgi:hypothetical protein